MKTLPYSPEAPVFRRPRKNVFFFHIPKTAGTTVTFFFKKRYTRNLLTNTLARPLPFDKVKSFWPNCGIFYATHLNWDLFEQYPHETQSFTFLRDPSSLIESAYYFIRASGRDEDLLQPEFHSMLKYSFKDWLKVTRDGGDGNGQKTEVVGQDTYNFYDNYYTRTLLGVKKTGHIPRLCFATDSEEFELALSRLHSFDAIGLAEDFDQSLISICLSCGIIPPAKEEIIRKNTADAEKRLTRAPKDDETFELLEEITFYDQLIYKEGKKLLNMRVAKQIENLEASGGTSILL
ncbi:MAG: hypothetical protein ABJO45_00060 [Lentilitoribacter sp.]